MNLHCTSKPLIKVKFVDFWRTIPDATAYFCGLLSSFFTVSLSEAPDLLFFSVFGSEHTKYDCTKIFFTGECRRPDFSTCDFALSFDFLEDSRHHRLPLYALYADMDELTSPPRHPCLTVAKEHFCCMMVSNAKARERVAFFECLSSRKFVHSAGAYLNNIGGAVPRGSDESAAKLSYIASFKFVFAFENQSYDGYTTEKILEPMLVGSIPIYWGNTSVNLDFNPRRFINAHDFSDFASLADYIIELDKDDDRYLEIIRQPIFTDNVVNDYVRKDLLVDKLRGWLLG